MAEPPARKSRILALAAEYPPFPYGVSGLTKQQCETLAEEFEVAVLTPIAKAPGAGASDEREGPLRAIRFQSIRTPVLRVLPYGPKAIAAFRSFRPDLIYCPEYRGLGPHALMLSKLYRKPLAAYFHGTELLTELKHPIRRAFARRYLAGCRAKLCNSRYTADLVRELLPGHAPEPEPIPPGLDARLFSEPASPLEREKNRRAVGIDGDRLALITVGRIDRRKALDLVARALAKLGSDAPELGAKLDWWIVGDGSERGDVLRLAKEIPGVEVMEVAKGSLEAAPRKGDGPRVVFWGLRSRDEVARLLRAADLFALASRVRPDSVESFGMVYVEANAAGLAAIGSRVGGVADAIDDGKTGLLVPPDDPAALAEAIRSLVEDPARRQALAEAGRRRALEQFDWSAIGPRLRSALRALLPTAGESA